MLTPEKLATLKELKRELGRNMGKLSQAKRLLIQVKAKLHDINPVSDFTKEFKVLDDMPEIRFSHVYRLSDVLDNAISYYGKEIQEDNLRTDREGKESRKRTAMIQESLLDRQSEPKIHPIQKVNTEKEAQPTKKSRSVWDWVRKNAPIGLLIIAFTSLMITISKC